MTKSAIRFAVLSVLVIAFCYGGIWQWGFCRFYVEPNQMAVISAKVGTSMPPGQILAEPGQKGIQRKVLGEGRHFLNPILYAREFHKVTLIEPGLVGVVTSKVGDDLPEGEFLANPGQKGIWKTLLGPGKYRMNPYGYQIDIVNAISIPIGYAGVITSLAGEQAPPGSFAQTNQKGVRKDILQPGLYYVNPKQYKVDVLEIGVNQVSLLGKTGGEVVTKNRQITANAAMEAQEQSLFAEQQARRDKYIALSSSLRQEAPAQAKAAQHERVQQQQERSDMQRASKYVMGDAMNTLGLAEFVEFPSRDGFNISLDMSVEVELHPSKIAGIFSNYGDLPAVVDKIIMPQITSISRNKGSEYGAKDFIVGEGPDRRPGHGLRREGSARPQCVDPARRGAAADPGSDPADQHRHRAGSGQQGTSEYRPQAGTTEHRDHPDRAAPPASGTGDAQAGGGNQGRPGEDRGRDPGRDQAQGRRDRHGNGQYHGPDHTYSWNRQG